MYVTADHLREQVIRPTLKYLGVWTPASEDFLLQSAVSAPELGLFSARNTGLGLFHITAVQHRDIWDRYLAFRPDMASRVRGLASACQCGRSPGRSISCSGCNRATASRAACARVSVSASTLELPQPTPVKTASTGLFAPIST